MPSSEGAWFWFPDVEVCLPPDKPSGRGVEVGSLLILHTHSCMYLVRETVQSVQREVRERENSYISNHLYCYTCTTCISTCKIAFFSLRFCSCTPVQYKYPHTHNTHHTHHIYTPKNIHTHHNTHRPLVTSATTHVCS